MIDRSIYINAHSASQLMQAMQVTTNNLANANTNGFRADESLFQSMVVEGGEFNTRTYSTMESTVSDLNAGTIRQTGNPLDIAVKGEGFIAVQSEDGKEGYTRSGSMHLTPDGFLATASGELVLGSGGPISMPPAQSITIGADGTIGIIPQGQDDNTMVTVERIKLVNPEASQLRKGEDGLFYLQAGEATADADVNISTESLEGSNVNVVNEMVNMISLSRNFEMQVKMLKQADKNAEQANTLLKI
jgi:flagellar basal-body rod protein FlgF